MHKSMSGALSVGIAVVVSLGALSPAFAAMTRGALAPVTASGNVISWSGGAIQYEAAPDIQPDGNQIDICTLGTNPCEFGGTGFLASVYPRSGATSLEVISLVRKMDGSTLGAGSYTAQMVLYTRIDSNNFNKENVGSPVVIEVPEYVAPSSSTPSGDSAPIVQPGSAPPAVGLALQATVGAKVEGASVSFTGVAMKAGSTYVLTVNSDPIVLATGVILEGGRIAGLPRLPALPPGTHTLKLTTTGWDGSTAVISQVFVVGNDGRILSISEPAGSITAENQTTERLAYTGVPSSGLPLWALSFLLFGLALVVYSARAVAMVNRSELGDALHTARTPWEILATPIRVPGIEYTAQYTEQGQSPRLAETIRELDVAFSKLIATQIAGFSQARSSS